MFKAQNNVGYISSEQTITVVLNGQNRTIQIKSKSHRNEVILALERFKQSSQSKLDYEELETFLAPIKRAVLASDRRFELDAAGKQLFLVGTHVPIPETLANKIMDFLDNGLPVNVLVKFWESCLKNPHYVAVEELFVFLEENHLPITDDGGFLGYKKLNFFDTGVRIDVPDDFEELVLSEDKQTVSSVSGAIVTPLLRKKYLDFISEANNPDMVDVHSGKIHQKVGDWVRIDRVKLNEEEQRNECGYGLHIGAFSYSFSGNVRVLCKVFPEDVIACNEGQAKLRTCKYQIVSFVDEAKEVKELLVDFNKTEQDICDGEGDYDDDEDYNNPFDEGDYARCTEDSHPDYMVELGQQYYVVDVDANMIQIVDGEGDQTWVQADFFEKV